MALDEKVIHEGGIGWDVRRVDSGDAGVLPLRRGAGRELDRNVGASSGQSDFGVETTVERRDDTSANVKHKKKGGFWNGAKYWGKIVGLAAGIIAGASLFGLPAYDWYKNKDLDACGELGIPRLEGQTQEEALKNYLCEQFHKNNLPLNVVRGRYLFTDFSFRGYFDSEIAGGTYPDGLREIVVSSNKSKQSPFETGYHEGLHCSELGGFRTFFPLSSERRGVFLNALVRYRIDFERRQNENALCSKTKEQLDFEWREAEFEGKKEKWSSEKEALRKKLTRIISLNAAFCLPFSENPAHLLNPDEAYASAGSRILSIRQGIWEGDAPSIANSIAGLNQFRSYFEEFFPTEGETRSLDDYREAVSVSVHGPSFYLPSVLSYLATSTFWLVDKPRDLYFEGKYKNEYLRLKSQRE